MKIAICGIGGRMGHAIFRIMRERGHSIAAAFDSPDSPGFGQDTGPLIGLPDTGVIVHTINVTDLKDADGIIDFSLPSGTMTLLECALTEKKPIVIGTTGFSPEEKTKINEASRSIPVLISPNMSVGVNLLFKLTEMAAAALPAGYDVEIFEAHHRHKKDAPSGTAARLVEMVRAGNTALAEAQEVSGREGIVGERSDNEIGLFAMRGGDIVGEHTVYFIGEGERIELTHRAGNRETFARGAVTAMEYLTGKGHGLYSMFDVLGL